MDQARLEPGCPISMSSSSSSSLGALYTEQMGNTQVKYRPTPETLLGRGSSGLVYPGFHFGLNLEVAVKYIEEKHLIADHGGSPDELKILQKITDSNIIRLVESFRSPKKGLFLALEKAQDTFHNEITKSNVQRENIILWLKQVGNGLEYLHKQRIIHRDIKPRNILMVLRDDVVVAKLSDFGLSKQLSIDSLNSGTLTDGKGTFPYMAPEVLASYGVKVVNTKALDIFALGMTIYYGLSKGTHPFQAPNDLAMKNRILNSDDKPNKVCKSEYAAQDLTSRMMEKDQNDRPKIGEVLSHSLFWDLKTKNSFLFDVARCLDTPKLDKYDTRINDIKTHIDISYKTYYKDLTGQRFNWLVKLGEDTRNCLLTSISSSKEKNYGDGQSATSLIKLFRDKLCHFTDMKTDAERNNTFTQDKTFSEEIYTDFFLEIAPNIVDVIYCAVRDWSDDSIMSLVKSKYFSWCSSSSSSLGTPSSLKRSFSGASIQDQRPATVVPGTSIKFNDSDKLSENVYSGFSNGYLNPAAVHVIQSDEQKELQSAAEAWKSLSSEQPYSQYLVAILEMAEVENTLYVATELAPIKLSDEVEILVEDSYQHQVLLTQYIRNIMKGVAWLHHNKRVLGKIDPGHVLIFRDTTNLKFAKLGYLKTSQVIDEKSTFEIRKDILSIGHLLQFTFSGYYEPSQRNKNGVLTYAAAKDYAWSHLFDWITLETHSSKQPTILQVLNHPMFWDINKTYQFFQWFWINLSINGKKSLNDNYRKLYNNREKKKLNWASLLDKKLLIPKLANNADNIYELLVLLNISANESGYPRAYKDVFNDPFTVTKLTKYIIQLFPDLLIVCFCAALGKGYISELHRDGIRKFLCDKDVDRDNIDLNGWMKSPQIFHS